MLSFTLGADSATVFLDGVFNTIDATHANFPPLLAELQKAPADRDLAAIRTYITIKSLIEHLSIGRVTVFDDAIHLDGQPIHNYMAERMLEILNQGIDLTPWAQFMDNLFDNPAHYAVNELYQWLEKARMPITPDGCFLAFKKVRRNYRDCHSGLFDNSPGNILEMDRDACNPNRDQTCSTGFHFCSIGYIGNFGGERVVVVKINPRDVTSIPSDYAFTKGRCCRYEVVAELDSQSAACHNCWRKGVVDLENPAEFPAGILSKIKLPDPVANEPAQVEDESSYDWPTEYDVFAEFEEDMTDDAEVSLAEIAAIHAEEDMIDAGKAAPKNPIRGEVVITGDAYGDRVKVTVDGTGLTPLQKLTTANEAATGIEIKTVVTGEGFPQTTAEVTTPVLTKENIQAAIDKTGAGWVAGDPIKMPAMGLTITVSNEKEPVFVTSDGREFSAEVIVAALEHASIRGAARNLGVQDSTLRGWKKKLGL